MIGDNAPPMDGWQMPRRHCGQWFDGYSCPTCGYYADSPNLVRGEN